MKALDTIRANPSGSVIFSGPKGSCKATAARELAAALNCLDGRPGQCTNCRQIAAGNFPDLIQIDRDDKPSLGIEAVRGLSGTLALRAYQPGVKRVVLIHEAHLLTTEAQNSLLKLLEEPPPATLIILLAEQPEALLPTVRSRCQTVRFSRLTEPGAATDDQVNLPAASSQFDRLLLAAKIATSDTDLEQYAHTLHQRVVRATLDGEIPPITAGPWLDSLERFRTHLRAKVTPRVALERLMLELG